MTAIERLDYLIDVLLTEDPGHSGIAVPESVGDKRRLLRAFPGMHNLRHSEVLEALKAELEEKLRR